MLRLKAALTTAQNLIDAPGPLPKPGTRRLLRALQEGTSAAEQLNEDHFRSIPSFVDAALSYHGQMPEILSGMGEPWGEPWGDKDQPLFQPWDDPRRRFLGVVEMLSGDRLVVGLTTLKEAPEPWRTFVNHYFRNVVSRQSLAADLNRNDLQHVPTEDMSESDASEEPSMSDVSEP